MEHHRTHTSPLPPTPAAAALSRLGGGLSPVALGPAPAAATPTGRPASAALWSALLPGDALPDAELQALDSLAQARQVAPGQPVLDHAGPASMLVALRSGEVALGLRTADGVLHTERILRGPAWLDLGSAWLASPNAMDGQALTAASVLDLPCDSLRVRLPQLPALSQRLLEALAREVRALVFNTQELMHKDAPARLAQWLHARSTALPGAPGGMVPAGPVGAQAVVRLHERKRDVASQLAITPETLSRLMRSFSRQAVIEVCGYDVWVLDTAALARLATG